MAENIEPSAIDWKYATDLQEWERQALGMVRQLPQQDFSDDAEPEVKLAYMGVGRLADLAPDLLCENADDETRNLRVTEWRLKYPEPASMKIAPSREGLDTEEAVELTGGSKTIELHRGVFYVRPGYPSRFMLAVGALWCRGFVAGRSRADSETRNELRRQLYELLQDATENMPPMPVAHEDEQDQTFEIQDQIAELLSDVARKVADGAFEIDLPPFMIEVGEDDTGAPDPRPQTEEHDPSPFQGDPPMASLLSDDFATKTTRALMDANGALATTHEGQWGRDSTGHPVRVEQLRTPYEGKAIYRIQAYGEPDPTAVEASMGLEMLNRMDMDTVRLNLLLLSYASATHRRGERPTIKIPRREVEYVFGFRSRNRTVKERAEAIKNHVEALSSVFVQFQNLRRKGDKLRFKGDMTAAPLWNLRMVAEGETDMFTGDTVADWHLEAREGLWATEFLHNHGGQWTQLPKEWFAKIDRRGSKQYAQRIAFHLLFQFRINAKNGNRVKRSAQTLLEMCGEDMTKPRDSKRRTELKRCLSEALDTLEREYGIRVHAERVHMDQTRGMRFNEWKGRVAAFDPPASMDGKLFRNAEGDPPPLPVVTGEWKPRQIRRLRTELLDETQSELGRRLDVSKQYVSQLERGTSSPSDQVCKILDQLQARHE
jgi:DNA-binding XRE family transcriptional regulator